MIRALLIASILVLVVPSPLAAQVDSSYQRRRSITIFAEAAFPLGPFAETSGQNASFATLGYGGGIALTTDVAPQFEVGLDLSYNKLGIDEQKLEQYVKKTYGVTINASNSGGWVFLNAMGTLGYNIYLGRSIRAYGRGKIGIVHCNVPDISSQQNHMNLGFGFGIGVADEKFDTGIHYFLATGDEFTASTNFRQAPSVLQLRFGYSFTTLIPE